MKDYYQILEISQTATNEEIKKQYRFLSQAWHPDKFPNAEQKAKAEEKIKAINEAYNVLGNPSKRKEYDESMGFQQEKKSENSSQPKPNDTNARNDKKDTKENPSSKSHLPWAFIISAASLFIVCVGVYSFLSSEAPQNVYLTPTHAIFPTNTSMPLQVATGENANIAPVEADTLSDSEKMMLVPAGEFKIGINDETQNTTSQIINLPNYYIDVFEVTNSGYEKCVTAGQCAPPTKIDSPSSPFYFGNPEFSSYPVIYVTWDMADIFCQWRDARLPTEAEWEKAARGADGRIYPWGSEFMAGMSNFCDINCPREWKNVNYNDGYVDTSPVEAFPNGKSPYGIFDMSGNVYEWVADSFYSNPTQNKVIRGGAWSDIDGVNSTSRATFPSSSSYEFIGFRCARDDKP